MCILEPARPLSWQAVKGHRGGHVRSTLVFRSLGLSGPGIQVQNGFRPILAAPWRHREHCIVVH